MKIALVGNPNCGKTALFNKLTGEKYPVGNRAGVTVEAVSGTGYGHTVFDLPGIYSLDSPVAEEKRAAEFLHSADLDLIVNVTDATHLTRNLYLTSQLTELSVPTVVALNMRDEAERLGISVDTELLSRLLGCPVVYVSARKDKAFDRLFDAPPCKKVTFPSDPAARYERLEAICARAVTVNKKSSLAERIDKILFNKYAAFPIFIIIMCATLMFGVGVFGNLLGKYIDLALTELSTYLDGVLDCSPPVRSLITDGLITGIGGVLQFAPLTACLFFILSLLEDCGYVARIAFITDRLFAAAGMSGRTAVSLIIGCGCTVPAVFGTRTIEDEKERVKCLNLVHLVPCSAKLPLLAMLGGAFFPDNILFTPLLYLVSVVAIFVYSAFLPGGDKPFIMEMPALKAPSFHNALNMTAVRLKSFLLRTCTVVFVVSIAVWVLIHFNFALQTCDTENSMLAVLGRYVKYAFYPIGLTDWRTAVAVFCGFAGKETVIGVLEILSGGDITTLFSPLQGISFALFMLLSSPCAAALSALKKELGVRKFLICLLRQIAFSYSVCALLNAGYIIAAFI